MLITAGKRSLKASAVQFGARSVALATARVWGAASVPIKMRRLQRKETLCHKQHRSHMIYLPMVLMRMSW